MSPPMTFRLEDLLDPDRMINGPFVVLWGQDEYIPPSDPLTFGERPPVSLRARLRGMRAFKIEFRFAPPAGRDLREFGRAIAGLLDLPHEDDLPPKPEHRAIFVPGALVAADAPGALGAAGRVVTRMHGLEVAEVQIRVEVWR